MKVRIIYKADKSFSVIHPMPKPKDSLLTDEQWLQRALDKATPQNSEYEDIEKSELPQTREDRAGWEKEKGKPIQINRVKADKFKKDRDDAIAVQEELKLMARERLANK